MAGEVCLRARWGLRQPLATWLRVARTDGVEEKARVIGEAALMRGVAAGRKTAGARKRRIEEENMMCGVDLNVAGRVALDNLFGEVSRLRV